MLSLIESGNQPFYIHDYKRICDALSISLTQLDERSETFKDVDANEKLVNGLKDETNTISK